MTVRLCYFRPCFPHLFAAVPSHRKTDTLWSTFRIRPLLLLLALLFPALPGRAVELHVGIDAIERTLRQQVFNTPDGRFYLKGDATWTCGAVYVEDPHLSGKDGRVFVQIKTHAQPGKMIMGKCVGLTLAPNIAVSALPVAEGETIGYGDVRLERASDQPELNFLLKPFLSKKLPSGMKVNAADLLRKALSDSTAKSGYKVALDKLTIRSVQVQGNDVVVDIDGALSVR
jgi:hypothetical protein